MYTSLILFALSASTVPTAELIPVAPSWRNDYSLALKEGQSSKRPLAIVVGSGSEGWDKLGKDGGLDKDARDLLHNNYVCLYLDRNNERHRNLIEQLELSGGPALVIGDASGKYQAFRHEGAMSNEDLDRYLRKYSDPERLVAKTETTADARSAAPVSRPAAPVHYPQPSYFQPSFRSFGGGCST
jgi:hypothetical protein